MKSRNVKCRKCRRTWNISTYTIMPDTGYTCPICKGIEAMDEQIFIKKNGYALNAYL